MFDIFGTKDPEKALQKAHEYSKEGKIESAIKVLENNLTKGEESFDVYMELARLYFETEQRGRTVELLRRLKSIAPSKVDEIIALISGLFYHHPSIDAGDFLIQLYIEKDDYEEMLKIAGELSDRDISLLLTRYEKIRQNIEEKNVIAKKDVENILIFASLKFLANDSNAAVEAIEAVTGIDTYNASLLNWARTITRERFNDPQASLLLTKIELASQEFDSALAQAQRVFEKSPEFVDPLITLIESAKPPENFEAKFTQFLTELYIKKGDFDKAVVRLQYLMTKDPTKIDEVIKGLRELERVSPKNLKIRYALGDTYLNANKISLAMNEFAKILERDPNQYQEVLQRYEKAFEKEPNNPLVIQGMVNIYLERNEIDAAVALIENAYKRDPGLFDEYISNLNVILEKNLNNPKALYLLGLCYAQKGDKENALVIFDSLVEIKECDYVCNATKDICEKNPYDLQYLNLRAKSFAMLGREEEAVAMLASFLEQKPEEMVNILPTLDAIINKQPNLAEMILPLYEQYKKIDPFIGELAMARAYAFSGEYEKSVSGFQTCFIDEKQKDTTKRALIEVIRERPNALPLLLTAARIFLKVGDVEVATQFFKTAQRVDPKAFFEIVDEFYDVLKAFPKDRGVWILLIDTFFSRKLWARVIGEAKRAVEVFGKDAQYFNLKLGQALVESGSLSEAVRPLMLSLEGPQDYAKEVINYLDKILLIDKSNIAAHVAKGKALSRARRIDDAVEEFLLTARIVPTRAEYILQELDQLSKKAVANAQLIFAMGKVEITLKQYDDAVKHLLNACELEPTLVKRVIPLMNKLSQEAPSPLLDFSLAKVHQLSNLKSSAIKYYIKAQAQDKAFREPAISELKRICAENPNDTESRKGLAEIHFGHNNLEDALDSVKEIYELNAKESSWARTFVSSILEKNPQHMPSYYFLGKIFLNEKNYKMAIEVYEQIIEISPTEVTKVIDTLEGIEEKDHSELLLYLAILYKNAGDVQRAVELLDGLFSIDTSFGEAIIYQIKEILMKNADLGKAYLLASKIFSFQKEYERAIEAIKRARELIPENGEIILKEGQLYYEMGKVEQAIKIYSELLNKTKDRKSIYRLMRKTREQYFKEKIEMIKGDEDDDRLKRANIHLLMNNIVEAEKELQFVPRNNLSIKHYTLLKAKVYLKKSRPMDALEIMKSLPVDKETAPVYADVYEAMDSFKAAAMVLRQSGIEDVEPRIASDEKFAQERRLVKERYLIEGRS